MLKRTLILLIACMTMALPSRGWIDYPDLDPWNLVHIARINYTSTAPTASNTAPEAANVALPATVWVKVQTDAEDWNFDIDYMCLQYKVVGKAFGDGETWHALGPVYDNPGEFMTVEDYQAFFGENVISEELENVEAGDTILVRFYFANSVLGYVSNDLDTDTNGEGENGWRDERVVEITTTINRRPTWDAPAW